MGQNIQTQAVDVVGLKNGAGARINPATEETVQAVVDAIEALSIDGVDLDIRDLSHGQDSVRIGDGTDLVEVQQGDVWGGHDPSAAGMNVNSRGMQFWPGTGNRTGVSGDNNYYGQIMNDLGDLVISLGSITNASGSNAIESNTGNAGAGTQRVVLASDQPTVDVEVQNATIEQTIGDAVNTLVLMIGAKDTSGNVRHIQTDTDGQLQVDVLTIPNVTVVSLPSIPTGSNTIGIVDQGAAGSDPWPVGHGKTIKSSGGSVSSSGNNTLLSAVTAKKIKVFAFVLSTTSTTAVTCIFQDGAGGTELHRVILQAPTSTSTGIAHAVAIPAHLFETSVNTLLNLNLSDAQTIHWSLSYIEEA